MYKIGERLMEIPHFVLSKLAGWNKIDPSFDSRFVAALILSLTESEKILRNEIPEEVSNFIKGI